MEERQSGGFKRKAERQGVTQSPNAHRRTSIYENKIFSSAEFSEELLTRRQATILWEKREWRERGGEREGEYRADVARGWNALSNRREPDQESFR